MVVDFSAERSIYEKGKHLRERWTWEEADDDDEEDEPFVCRHRIVSIRPISPMAMPSNSPSHTQTHF